MFLMWEIISYVGIMDQFAQNLSMRVKALRSEHSYSLADLSELSGVSRATLSRLENGEVSPTTEVLSKLCSVYRLSMSQLMSLVEEGFQPLVTANDQELWRDEIAGLSRRIVSPPATALKGEVVRCVLEAGRKISYDKPSVVGLEHHLVMLSGQLLLTVEGEQHRLFAGDCLRYRLNGSTHFDANGAEAAIYLLFLV